MLAFVIAALAAAEGPCDITGAAGNPCVAAHSTVRALYSAYAGGLYVLRKNATQEQMTIGVLEPGGFADQAKHDAFCGPKKDCVVLSVLDQSPMKNHLTQRHGLINASRHPIVVGDGTGVYGMWFDPGYGYHVDDTRGIAQGNEAESIYAVMSGSRHTGPDAAHKGCCFDYGNSEDSRATKNASAGSGAMEAIYFGNTHWMQNAGDNTTVGPDGQVLDGPWVGADLEAGMYYGGGKVSKYNPQNKPLIQPFVSLYLRGGTDGFALKGGDATKGRLQTMYDGPRPDCKVATITPPHPDAGASICTRQRTNPYNVKRNITPSYQPMHKQGAIVLATGGDNSNSAIGNFYEGIMVTGATSDVTDDLVQKNIVAVGYKNLP